MPHKKLRLKRGFRVALGNARSQAAEMVLPPGETEGGPDNRHRGSDQWLYVTDGTGLAIVAGRRVKLAPGVLLLIEHGQTHEIRNTGDEPLATVNFYVPPAYTDDGDELPSGKN